MSATEPTIATLLERGRGRYPDIAIDEARFVAIIEDKRRADPTASIDPAELVLACGCATGDPRALAELEATYFPVIERALAPMKLASGTVDEVRQLVRTKLLVAEDGAAPKLLEYAGRGALEGLVRVIAVRCALNLVRQQRKDVPLGGDVADEILAVGVSPELQIVKQRYRDQFKRAFTTAIEELSPRDRTILKLHLVDRLVIDDLGALFKVHRATAARWLEAIRDKLGDRTKELLGQRLELDTGELDSVLRVVHSQISLSLSRVLSP